MCDCDCELSKYDKWERIKREHAHELADKIRGHYGQPRWEGDEPEYAYGYNAGTHDAADLIDPEVSGR